jgi:hypothetical protein
VPETAGPEIFKSREELERLVEGWLASRLVEIWNRLPGAKPVHKFTDWEDGRASGLEGHSEFETRRSVRCDLGCGGGRRFRGNSSWPVMAATPAPIAAIPPTSPPRPKHKPSTSE